MKDNFATPFFSVVVPVYNKGPHVARTLNSILNQSYSNFELLVVCDPSTDNSEEEVLRFTDPRIRVFYRDQPGPGGYAARNVGIKESKADWVAFLDADDEWYSNHLESMRALIERYPEAKILTSAWRVREGDNIEDNLFSKHENKNEVFLDFECYLSLEVTARRPICTSVACISRKLLIEAGMFPDGKISMGGDVDTWFRCIEITGGVGWSSNRGAVYNKDSVNMVTKSSLVLPDLHVATARRVMKKIHSDNINLLLMKRTNNLVITAWNQNMHVGINNNFTLHDRLFYKVQRVKVTFYLLLSNIPNALLRPIHRVLFKIASFIRGSKA